MAVGKRESRADVLNIGVALIKEASKPAVRWLRNAVCTRGGVAKRDKPLLAETLGFPLPQKYCQW